MKKYGRLGSYFGELKMINERILMNKIEQIQILRNWSEVVSKNIAVDSPEGKRLARCYAEATRLVTILMWIDRGGSTIPPNEFNLNEFENTILECEANIAEKKNEHN